MLQRQKASLDGDSPTDDDEEKCKEQNETYVNVVKRGEGHMMRGSKIATFYPYPTFTKNAGPSLTKA